MLLQNLLEKKPEELTIGEKIKRATIDESFTWEHVYELLLNKFVKWWDALLLKLPNLIIGIIVFLFFILIAKYLSRLLYSLLKRYVKEESIRFIVVKIFKLFISFFGFFVFLVILDLGVLMTSILGLAGVASLAIGLAVQGVLNNTFSGVILSFLPRLKIGDWVETNGLEGTVSEISLRSVQILRPDNNLVMVPNSQILESPFINYSLTERMRISISCGIAYNSDLKKVRELTISHFQKTFPQKKGEKVELFYTEFGESSINFKLRFWGNALGKLDELDLINRAIIELKSLFDENQITIPFPIRTIEIKSKE